MDLTWVEISKKALKSNFKAFQELVGSHVKLAPVIKANAYGHGLVGCAKIFLETGADFLCVNSLFEVELLRQAGVKSPILIIGYVPLADLKKMATLNCDLTVYNLDTINELGRLNKSTNLHLKIETGIHRQGFYLEDILKVIESLKKHKYLQLAGISTHFASADNPMSHKYSLHQLKVFKEACHLFEIEGYAPRYKHAANSAATILIPEARFNFVRPGIGLYGLWPSKEVLQTAEHAGMKLKLSPALTWKTIVAQVKKVKKGALVGYGSTYKMPNDGLIAILPVGYYDGYSRALSNKSHVLIRGKRAPVIGRVCMNMMMVDVSDIPEVKLEDEVVLLGQQGEEVIIAEGLAELSETINYEVVTRVNERIPRILID